MANDDHIAQLKKGVKARNAWRDENPDIRPDLGNADLAETDLFEANLGEADLGGRTSTERISTERTSGERQPCSHAYLVGRSHPRRHAACRCRTRASLTDQSVRCSLFSNRKAWRWSS
jgi:uncharacterized protein YjbI with pentapeptide repeats